MTVRCTLCGKEWPRDPALEVPCPTCGAAIGKRCRRPSGHPIMGGQPHASRDRAAMDAGKLHRCPKAPRPAQPDLFQQEPAP